MPYLLRAMLIVIGLIHLLPVTGVLGNERLVQLYGVAFTDPNLSILMRHRAMLFGLLGGFLIYAAFRPDFQPVALIVAGVSVLSFLALAWSVGSYNALIGRVVIADIVALVCWLVAVAAWFIVNRRAV